MMTKYMFIFEILNGQYRFLVNIFLLVKINATLKTLIKKK